MIEFPSGRRSSTDTDVNEAMVEFRFEAVVLIEKLVFNVASDEGLTLETSAFESLYGGQFRISPQLIKPNYLL